MFNLKKFSFFDAVKFNSNFQNSVWKTYGFTILRPPGYPQNRKCKIGLDQPTIISIPPPQTWAKDDEEARKLINDAEMLQELGCFGIVLEKIPAQLAKKVANSLSIPAISIGAGPHADGQVLVMHDMLGITQDFKPRFLRQYADLNKVIGEATKQYIKDIKSSNFPSDEESY